MNGAASAPPLTACRLAITPPATPPRNDLRRTSFSACTQNIFVLVFFCWPIIRLHCTLAYKTIFLQTLMPLSLSKALPLAWQTNAQPIRYMGRCELSRAPGDAASTPEFLRVAVGVITEQELEEAHASLASLAVTSKGQHKESEQKRSASGTRNDRASSRPGGGGPPPADRPSAVRRSYIVFGGR